MKLVIGVVLFAVLMAVHTEAASVWTRVVLAGCAGGVLAWALIQARRK